MNKTEIIKTFTTLYDNWNFKDQMYAMSALAESLNLRMTFQSASQNHAEMNLASEYQFITSNGRVLTTVVLNNSK